MKTLALVLIILGIIAVVGFAVATFCLTESKYVILYTME